MPEEETVAVYRYRRVTAEIQERHCPHCRGLHTGWVLYDRVGPNLPQRSITFRCSSCKEMLSKGLVYRYDDPEPEENGGVVN